MLTEQLLLSLHFLLTHTSYCTVLHCTYSMYYRQYISIVYNTSYIIIIIDNTIVLLVVQYKYYCVFMVGCYFSLAPPTYWEKLAEIVGGAVGGVALLLILPLTILCCCCFITGCPGHSWRERRLYGVIN